jgi:two-component system, NtrC family, sensor kinase
MADLLSLLSQALLPQVKLLMEAQQLLQDLEQRNHFLEQRSSQCFQKLAQHQQDYQDAATKLKQMQVHLAQMEKMSILGQMISGIAHEINNPITFIYGNLPYVEEHVQDLLKVFHTHQKDNNFTTLAEVAQEVDLDFILEDLPRIVDSMKLGADRVRGLVLTLRNFYRLDEPEMQPADLHEGIENTLILLQHRYRQEITIVKQFAPLPLVECHINQVSQVFMNLLGNAIDALLMEKEPPKEKQITIVTQQLQPGWVCISISDNGPGISLDIQQRLFEPFFTTKPMGIGTGLGLSISHQIITETHNGKIYCCSAPNEGTTFRVELPIQQQPRSEG